MSLSQDFLISLLPFAVVVSAMAAVIFLIRYQTAMALWGSAFSLALTLHLASYYLVLTGSTPGLVQVAFRIQIIALACQWMAWQFFVFVFSRHERWVNWRTLLMVGAIPALVIGKVMSYPALDPHGSVQGEGIIGSLMALTQQVGWLGNLFIAYGLGGGFFSLGLLAMLLPTARSNPAFRAMILALCFGLLLILLAEGLDLLSIYPFAPFPNLQLGYLVISLFSLFIAVQISAGGLLPIARSAVFENIQDAVLVLDQNSHLVDINSAGLRIIGHSEREALGKPISQAWPDVAHLLANQADASAFEGELRAQVNGLASTFDVRVSAVRETFSQGRIGWAVVLRDVTGRDHLEKTFQEHARELERTNRLVTALSTVTARLENTSDPDLVLVTLGAEMQRLGLECAVVTIDLSGETATIKYVSFHPQLIQRIEKVTGIRAINYVIPKRYWPGDRILKEKAPVWYPNPAVILRRMFPQIPEGVAQNAFQLLGIQPDGYICILPLLSENNVIGAIPIWGANLQPADGPVLTVFASQVSSILQRVNAHERETRRANDLARSNGMILALSKVAARLDSTSDFDVVVRTFGDELKRLAMESMVGTLDSDKQVLTIQYISIRPDVIRWAEKATGRSLTDLSIPRHLWPTEKVVTERTPYWDPKGMKGTLRLFPVLPEKIQRAAMQMAGINLDDAVAYFPIIGQDDIIGVLAVWGSSLHSEDLPALSVFASQLGASIRNARLYENEARRANELTVLLQASEATSSAAQLDDVLLTLASQLLELSGLQSCFISEWDEDTDRLNGRLDFSHVFWVDEKRESYSLSDYPRSRQVLITGSPIILKGDSEAEEKKWMDALGRTDVILLALPGAGETLGLVELATTKKDNLFDPHVLAHLTVILAEAGTQFTGPVSSNAPRQLFQVQEALMRAAGAEICSFSEWDRMEDRLLTVAVSAKIIWKPGEGRSYRSAQDALWLRMLERGQASVFVRTEPNEALNAELAPLISPEVETLVVFPLQRGGQGIGLVELYDFNHRRPVTAAQIALLRTVADKAGYSIQNARLLEQTQRRLDEKTALLNEKVVLLKEVHHRVKNNLQVISSLLNLQASHLSDPRIKEALRESQSRVRTMALIHEKLYQSADLAKIDFAAYVQGLVSYLADSYQRESHSPSIQVRVEEIRLDLETAVPCGLILNELVSNSLKHAFPDGRAGEIQVDIARAGENKVQFQVCDDGIGFSPNVEFRRSTSLGLRLIDSLVEQINGTLTWEVRAGTRVTIQFATPTIGM